MNPTKPAIPVAIRTAARRSPTLIGVAVCANAPSISVTRTGYSTVTPRASSRTREAVRVDFVRRAGK